MLVAYRVTISSETIHSTGRDFRSCSDSAIHYTLSRGLGNTPAPAPETKHPECHWRLLDCCIGNKQHRYSLTRRRRPHNPPYAPYIAAPPTLSTRPNPIDHRAGQSAGYWGGFWELGPLLGCGYNDGERGANAFFGHKGTSGLKTALQEARRRTISRGPLPRPLTDLVPRPKSAAVLLKRVP